MRIFATLLALATPLVAQPSLVETGFNHFYNLEYEEAAADFEKAIAKQPADPDLHNHLAQTLVFQEMYRDGALESELVSGTNSFLRRPKLNPAPATEARFLSELSKAMSLSEARLRTNPKDTEALYALGISHGLRANYHWIVKKAWRDSLSDANAARRYHNRISEIDPKNIDARLVQGLHDYLIGSLPLSWRMLGFIAGIRGDREKGIRAVEEVAARGKSNRRDAQILLCAIYRRENVPKFAIPVIQDLILRFPRNYILRLELSQMYSMTGDKARALDAVNQIADLKRRRAPGYDRVAWEKIWFQQGVIQFWYNDLEPALANLRKVTAAAPSVDANTGAYAYLRIGQIYDLTNRRAAAVETYKQAIAFAPEAEVAQEARKYLSSPYRPK